MNAVAALGTELRLDLAGCDPRRLDEMDHVERVVMTACERLRVEVVRTARHHFAPQGVSVVAILAESHLAVHTWPEHRAATVDVFTCGSVDPVEVVGLFVRAFAAGTSRVSRQERLPLQEQDEVDHYPGFPEYPLRSVPGGGRFPVPRFRRGIGRQYILEAEAVAWHDFFCGEAYHPPEGQDILFLHPCTWAKPYDMSANVARLRQFTDDHPRVHRVILSNVGLVPYEYQTNPFFCSYDYAPADRRYSDHERRRAQLDFEAVTRERIQRYLRSRAGDYRAVVALSHRRPGGLWRVVAETAKGLGLPGLILPRVRTLREVRRRRTQVRDVDDWLFDDASLADIGHALARLHQFLERHGAPDLHGAPERRGA